SPSAMRHESARCVSISSQLIFPQRRWLSCRSCSRRCCNSALASASQNVFIIGSASDDAVTLADGRGSGIDSEVVQNGHQRLAELLERCHRIPDIENRKLVAAAKADVIEPARRRAGTGGCEPADTFVILRGIH